MKKEDLLQIAEDAWGLYENAAPTKRAQFDQVLELADLLIEMVPVNDATAEQSQEKLATVLGGMLAIRAMKKNHIEFVGGKYRARSKSAPE